MSYPPSRRARSSRLMTAVLGAACCCGPALAGNTTLNCVPCSPCPTGEMAPMHGRPIHGGQFYSDTVPMGTAPMGDPAAPSAQQDVSSSQGEPDSSTFFGDSDFSSVAEPNFDLSSGLATNFGGGGAGSLAFADSPIATPGYIESAIIQNRVRVRYDNAWGANDPARAGFLYPTPADPQGTTGGRGPGGIGPVLGPGSGLGAEDIDIQEVSTYIELAPRDRFSVFIDVPVRWIGPLGDETQRGAGDIRAGFRWGWIANHREHLTFQLRTSLPTGEATRGLGTGNTSIDVGLLYDKQIGPWTRFYAELNNWQTLDAVTLDDVSGTIDASLLNQDANILRGGAGLGFDLFSQRDRCNTTSVTLLTECVFWTVLDGNTVDWNTGVLADATGDTIVNGKYGARFTRNTSSFYIGYGHNWTSDRWYSDLLRLEYQRTF